jgi:hypothetical protein
VKDEKAKLIGNEMFQYLSCTGAYGLPKPGRGIQLV